MKTLKWASIQVPRTRFACYFKTLYINFHILRKYNISISALWMSQFWQIFLNCWSKLFAKKSNYICPYLWVGWRRFPNILVFGPRLVLLEKLYVISFNGVNIFALIVVFHILWTYSKNKIWFASSQSVVFGTIHIRFVRCYMLIQTRLCLINSLHSRQHAVGKLGVRLFIT